ncbi:MAG: hypothetical protein ACRC33_05145, partial [Gemmataceae bacterium]
MGIWNAEGNFSLGDHDTGLVVGANYRATPWGARSWGVQGRTFGGAWTVWVPGCASDGPIAGQRYSVRDGRAYLYGNEDSGRYGFVRYILGNVWTAGQQTPAPLPLFPGPLSHPRPLARHVMNRDSLVPGRNRPLSDIRPLRLTLDLYRGATALNSSTAARVMYAVNFWITGPDFPAGRDAIGRKPLVFDLAFYTDGTALHGGIGSFVSPGCFHYQETVGTTPLSSWTSFDIDLKAVIVRALTHFGLRRDGAAIYQLE